MSPRIIYALILAKTLGIIFPRFRRLIDWLPVHMEYIASQSIQEKTKQNRLHYISKITDNIGWMGLGSIRPHHVAAVMRAITSDTSAHMAKRTFIELRCMFREAIAYGWLDRDPTAAVKPPTVVVARRRLLLQEWRTMAEYAFDHCQPRVYAMLILALITGQRRSDLLKMKWSDVWDGSLHITQAKTGARLAIPLTLRLDVVKMSLKTALSVIRANYTSDASRNSVYILCKNNGKPLTGASLSYRFECVREACLTLDLSDCAAPSLHEIRSLSGRCYDKQGLDVQRLLGHSHVAMTRVYLNTRGLPDEELSWEVVGEPA